MFFPISDDDSTLVRPAWVTIFVLAANVALFLLQYLHPAFSYGFAAVPAEITTGKDLVGTVTATLGGQEVAIRHAAGPVPIQLTVLSAMFMHGGWLHLGGNMLYLWIFGDNVEHRFGAVRFLIFYLVSGIAATFAQIAVDPDSIIPTLGASGAISGVLGAYMVLFPTNRVHCLLFFRMVSLPAVLVLGLWILLQFANGGGQIMASEQTGGVAYAAHIGGFFAGLIAGALSRLGMDHEPDTAFRRIAKRDDDLVSRYPRRR
ncbi:rhomboid family intramembrane serine protease [Haloferula sargassicola]|uniref:Peptidase S54 rhomboid domain-containing protein n=1 Tax=Haloferula sargassicola TaxID=490096 RepID=A0ABP9UW40_9BACT